MSDLEAAVAAARRHMAWRNEWWMALLRAPVWCVIAVVDVAVTLQPQLLGQDDIPIDFLLVTPAGAVGSIALAAVLSRGWWRPWLALAVPAWDGLLGVLASHNTLRVIGPEAYATSGGAAVATMGCVFYALSGGVRLSYASAAITTALAMGLYTSLALSLASPGPALIIELAQLAAFGGVAFAIAYLLRRTTRAEVGRVALERFLPAEVVERAHDDPVGLVRDPRRIEVTVLVTDLRGFTAWSEGRAPSAVLELLNEVQDALAGAVQGHGGVVDKFIGDGMLAVFEGDGHADRAIEAARAIAALGVGPLPVGVGVHTGEVVSGVLGGEHKLEFTVIGDTVNTASRVESLTKEHGVSVLLTDETLRAARGSHVVAEVGEVDVRGRSAPIRLHRLQ